MNKKEHLSFLKEKLGIHNKNLADLRLKKAKYGIDVPTNILRQIEDEENAIKKLEIEINKLVKKPFEIDKNFNAYLKSALNEHRFLPTQGFETTLRVPIELEWVFVNMHANIHVQEFEFTLKGKDRMEEKIRQERLTSLDIKSAFETSARHKIKDMVILGDPGSGKTTLLKYILVTLIEGKYRERLGLEEDIIPFFLPLRQLRDPAQEGFNDFIKRVCGLGDFSISDDSFKELLENRQSLILLDGLDEVANEAIRIKTCEWIDNARKRLPDTRFVITSRYAGYLGRSRLKGSLLELSIQNFTLDEAREFLVRWFEAVEIALHPVGDEARWKKKGHQDALVLIERIAKSEHLKKLAVNPLLLQIIALVHRDRGTLPQRRVELYEECTNVLLEKWDIAKGLDVLLTARQARQVLQPLALWLHEKDERRSAPLKEIKEVIKAPLEEIGKSSLDPKVLLLNIRDRSGIFMGYSEKEFGFTHLSFQEYLSAEEIRNKRDIKILISKYGNRWWREVILLCLALDNPSIIEEFIEALIPTEDFLEEINLVISAINDSIIKPSKPFITALNNKKLAPPARYNSIRALKEIGGNHVIQALKQAVNSQDDKLKFLAFYALNSLGADEGILKPVIEEVPEVFINPIDNSKMVLVPAGTFLYGSREDDKFAGSDEKPQRVIDLPAFYIDAFPVTNEQYCAFLNSKKPDDATLSKWIDLKVDAGGERCRIKRIRIGHNYSVEKKHEKHPVIYVSWYGANAYTEWAEKRLPTEEEWEKSARGTDGRRYPWGNEFDKNKCNTRESGNGRTTPMNKYSDGVSPYGCYDMVGNVWEWTASWYDEEENFKVVRGGSWDYFQVIARCAARNWFGPESRNALVGFRCVRTSCLVADR